MKNKIKKSNGYKKFKAQFLILILLFDFWF